MSYTKQSWKKGEGYRPAKLNHIEQGIADAASGGGGGGVLLVTATYNDDDNYWALDKTVAEIAEAIESGMNVFLRLDGETDWITVSCWAHEEGSSAEVEFSYVVFYDGATAVTMNYIHVCLEEGSEGGEDSVYVEFLNKELLIGSQNE